MGRIQEQPQEQQQHLMATTSYSRSLASAVKRLKVRCVMSHGPGVLLLLLMN
jgi:tRNA G37 N-methylase Trm5